MNSEYKRIIGTRNYYVTSDGFVFKKTGDYTFRQLVITTNNITGYSSVLVRDRNGKWIGKRVHQLVAEAFLTKPKYVRNLELNHLDGVKSNNAASNLRYVSHQQNMQHAWKMGLCDRIPVAVRKKRASMDGKRTELTPRDVQQIRRLRGEGFKLRELGLIYNLHPVNICAICNRRTWKNVI